MDTGLPTVYAWNQIDPEFEAALVNNHGDFLKFLTRRLRSADEAEEVLQQFYLRAIRNASKVRNSERVVAWLYRVLRSTLVDHYRREAARRSNVSAFAQIQLLQESAHESSGEGQVCLCLYKVLPTLKPEYCDVLRRVDLAGECRSRVAEMNGLTLNNLTVRLHRARQALKRALLSRCETCTDVGFMDCECDIPRFAGQAEPERTTHSSSAHVS